MRAAITLIGGNSARAATSAAALATCGFLVTGHGTEVVRTAAYAGLWLMAAGPTWFALALAGSLASDTAPEPKDADHAG